MKSKNTAFSTKLTIFFQMIFDAFINKVELIGNKLPHPFWLFTYLAVGISIISCILYQFDVSVTYLSASKIAEEAPKETTIYVQNLLSSKTVQAFFENFTNCYSGFAPLGLVMLMMMSVGMLEKTGMLSALIRKTILGAPSCLIIAIIAFVGVNANLASDAGVIIVPAVAGALFQSMGINPWIGIIAGYVAANGGFSASFFVAGTDVLLSGISESVVHGMNISATINPLMNWYFMMASSVVIIGGTILVTEFFTKRRINAEFGNIGKVTMESLKEHRLTDIEKKALNRSILAGFLYIAFIVALTIPENSIFRNESGNLLPKSPFMNSIVPLLFFFFIIIGIVYGIYAGTIKQTRDVPELMKKGLSSALTFMVIALPASIFIWLFNESNISTVIGVYGADLLSHLNMTGYFALIIFVLIASCFNIFLTSGSAKWLIMAPVFIPMFSLLNFSPAMTQATYRIADCCTNIISPVDYYIPVIMGLLETFKTDENRDVGIGTVISLCLPYTIIFMIGLLILLFIWYVFAFPLGPGCPMYLK